MGAIRGDWMRVLHVITGANVGGAETMLARLVERRAAAPDIEPAVATLTPPGPAGARIAAAGAPVHDLGLRSLAHAPAALARLAALVRRTRPDLLMGWMHHAQLAATLAVRLAGPPTPVIWNVRHSLGGLAHEKRTTRAVLRAQAALSGTPAAIVYNSAAARGQYEAFGFRGDRALVIPNGFPRSPEPDRRAARARAELLFDVPAGRLLVGLVARAHPMKDVPNLLAAFATLLDRGVDAHLLLAGEGMDRPAPSVAALMAVIPPGRRTLAGRRGDVDDWLPGLDILAVPSAWGEGFPNILGEAMLAGVASVATDVGDSRWILGDDGRVVPPRDAPALADALSELAALGPEGRAALGRAARRSAMARFDLDAVAARYAALCRATAAATTRPGPAREAAA